MKNTEKGFTLLFAVLVSTLILAVGAAIISIALKQIIISGSARDSQYAFYAANTGVECARYWDLNTSDGLSIFPDHKNSTTSIETSAECVGVNIMDEDDNEANWTESDSNSTKETTFRIQFAGGLPYCVDVKVIKEEDNDDSALTKVTIDSRGYNTCDEDNPRRIERGLEVTYSS